MKSRPPEGWESFEEFHGDCVRACAGLTPEQVAAIPRLVATYTEPAYAADVRTPAEMKASLALRRLFPRRES